MCLPACMHDTVSSQASVAKQYPPLAVYGILDHTFVCCSRLPHAVQVSTGAKMKARLVGWPKHCNLSNVFTQVWDFPNKTGAYLQTMGAICKPHQRSAGIWRVKLQGSSSTTHGT